MDLLKTERLEGDPANWSFKIFYRCKADPRWIVPVPDTNGLWSPNTAHAPAVILAIVLYAAALGPFIWAAATGRMREPKVAFVAIFCLGAFLIPPGAVARYRSG